MIKTFTSTCLLVVLTGCGSTVFSKKIHSIEPVHAPASWACEDDGGPETSWACEIVNDAMNELLNVRTDEAAAKFADKFGAGFLKELESRGEPASAISKEVVLDCNRRLLAMVVTLDESAAKGRAWHNAHTLRVRRVAEQLYQSIRQLYGGELIAKG